MTNLILVNPEVIADLYRARWQVELFFRWLKQHLNVTTLFRAMENAVYGQLFGACIAYVLLHILYHWKKPRRFQTVSMLDFRSMETSPGMGSFVVRFVTKLPSSLTKLRLIDRPGFSAFIHLARWTFFTVYFMGIIPRGHPFRSQER
ncbi:ISGsu1 transposase [Desmospora sp. 8437]|nr:ISGsu1 transposase [Desmospora sp. 8437]